LLTLLNAFPVLIERLKREDGQTIVEYGLVIGGISLVLITLFVVTGLGTVFTELIGDIDKAMTGDAG
jgi:Flp pilus assembly pilin Flp